MSGTLQNAFYIAINLQDILYGVELVLYFKTVRAVLTHRRKCEPYGVLCVLFITAMLLLITVWVATFAMLGEEMWLIHSGYPGGASTFWLSNQTVWYSDLGRAAVFVLQLMTDALLIYRCRAIYNNARVITIVPWVLWFATLILGILQNWTYDSQGGDFLYNIASKFGLAYYAVCVLLNMILTSMICYRVFRHGKMVHAELGHGYSSMYFAIVEMVVESALLFTLSGIALLVTLGLNTPISIAFSSVYFMMTCISPQMLILRVLDESGLEQDTSESTSAVSDIKFQHWSEARGGDECEGALSLRPFSKMHSAGESDNVGRMGVSP